MEVIQKGFSMYMTTIDNINYLIDNTSEDNIDETLDKIVSLSDLSEHICCERLFLNGFSKNIVSKYLDKFDNLFDLYTSEPDDIFFDELDELLIKNRMSNVIYSKEFRDEYLKINRRQAFKECNKEDFYEKVQELFYNNSHVDSITEKEIRLIFKYSIRFNDIPFFKQLLLTYSDYEIPSEFQCYLLMHKDYEIFKILEQKNVINYNLIIRYGFEIKSGYELIEYCLKRVNHLNLKELNIENYCIQELIDNIEYFRYDSKEDIYKVLVYKDKRLIEVLYKNNRIKFDKHDIQEAFAHEYGISIDSNVFDDIINNLSEY